MTGTVRIDPLSLRFADPVLEARFRRQYRLSATRQVRVTLLVGGALFLAFGFVDGWAEPRLAEPAWPVRLSVAGAFLGAVGISFAKSWDRIRGKVLWAVALLGAVGMFALIAIGGPWLELRWVGLVLVVLGADTLLRLTFPSLVTLSAAILAAWPAALAIAGALTAKAAIGGAAALTATYGVIGESRLIYDLWGDAVTTASRMESHGMPGAIQVTAAVRERLADRYVFADRGEIDVKGRGRMRTWLLQGKRPLV